MPSIGAGAKRTEYLSYDCQDGVVVEGMLADLKKEGWSSEVLSVSCPSDGIRNGDVGTFE